MPAVNVYREECVRVDNVREARRIQTRNDASLVQAPHPSESAVAYISVPQKSQSDYFSTHPPYRSIVTRTRMLLVTYMGDDVTGNGNPEKPVTVIWRASST